jgi:hypothetical protein
MAIVAVVVSTTAGLGSAAAVAARTSSTTDAALRKTVAYWFGRIGADYSDANMCHGCPSGDDNISSDGLQCMKDLNRRVNFADTRRYVKARNDAFEACRYYVFFAVSWSRSYTALDSQTQSDQFALAKSQLATARRHARAAATIFGLRTYP